MTATVLRRRLDPQVRRDLILDEAARIVADEGVSAVSMERMGREAGVSKALVYNYFPSRNALLSELLIREYRRFQAEARQMAVGARGELEEVIRVTTRAYLRHVAERGMLIQRLMNEPAVAAAIRTIDREGRQLTVAFFARGIAERYGLDPGEAATVADILMGLTGAAGDYLSRNDADPAYVENLVVAMITAALERVAARQA